MERALFPDTELIEEMAVQCSSIAAFKLLSTEESDGKLSNTLSMLEVDSVASFGLELATAGVEVSGGFLRCF